MVSQSKSTKREKLLYILISPKRLIYESSKWFPPFWKVGQFSDACQLKPQHPTEPGKEKRNHGNNTALWLDACQAVWHTWVSSASVHSTGHHEGCFYREEKAQRGSQHPQGHTAAEPEGGSIGRRLPGWLRSPLPTGLTEELGAQNCVLKSPILPHPTRPQGWKMQCCRWRGGKESACQCRRPKRCGFNPWIRKLPWRRKWQCHFLSLAGSWGHKESDRTEGRNSDTSESWQIQRLESKCSQKDMKMVRVSSSSHFWRCILKTIPCFCQQIETLFLSQIFLRVFLYPPLEKGNQDGIHRKWATN